MGHTFYDLLKDAAFAGGGGGSPAPVPVLIEKSVIQNGTYAASSDNADGYSSVSVEVEPDLTTKSITANGTYNATSDDADGYSSVSVAVPNSYTAQDEGKVVSNGALVSQISDTVTENGTVDTTLINSLLVNVSGGSGSATKLSGEKAIDAYIMQTDEYVYMFGCVYPSGYRKITLPVPDGFTLGTFIHGVSFQQYSTSYRAYSLYSAAISNNEVTLQLSTDYDSTSTNTWMIAVFNISI